MKLLKKVGLPQWVIQAIRLLFTNIQVQTTFHGAVSRWVDIKRGIKQGCPLSPLLFILAMDVLITALRCIKGLDIKAFADDIGIGTRNLTESVNRIARIFDAFSEASGLFLNGSKTKIVSNSPPSEAEKIYLKNSRWSQVEFVAKGTYLGMVIGRNLWNDHAWEKALEKFRGRCRLYAPLHACFSLAKRVFIANTYLLSIFSYIWRFYNPPMRVTDEINSLYKFWVGSNLYSVDSLKHPPKFLGLHNPLRDISFASQAALAATPFIKNNYRSKRSLSPRDWVTRCSQGGLSILMDFEFEVDRDSVLSYGAQINASDNSQTIYKKIINSPFCTSLYKKEIQRKLPPHLKDKWETIANNVTGASVLPPFIRGFQIRLSTDSLPVSSKFKWARQGGAHIKQKCCPLCFTGSATEDSIHHIFNNCAPVQLGASLVAAASSCSPYSLDHARLATEASKKTACQQIIFNYAVWQSRNNAINSGAPIKGANILNLFRAYALVYLPKSMKPEAELMAASTSPLRPPPKGGWWHLMDGISKPDRWVWQ